jgi:LemA protein
MGPLVTVVLVLFGLVVVLAFGLMTMYNRLVTLRNRFRNAFAQIDVQLKRRHDLVPNLVQVAKAYLQHERQTLEAVVQARAAAMQAGKAAGGQAVDPNAIKKLMGAEALLTGALGRFFAVVEGYPELKGNENMMQLSEELTSTENRIAFARQAYNDAVMVYNTTRERVPHCLVAGTLGFHHVEFFEIDDEAARARPDVPVT